MIILRFQGKTIFTTTFTIKSERIPKEQDTQSDTYRIFLYYHSVGIPHPQPICLKDDITLKEADIKIMEFANNLIDKIKKDGYVEIMNKFNFGI